MKNEVTDVFWNKLQGTKKAIDATKRITVKRRMHE